MAAIVLIKCDGAWNLIFTFSAASGKESGGCERADDLNSLLHSGGFLRIKAAGFLPVF